MKPGKIQYEVDPFNRLIIKGRGVSSLRRFRKVLSGRFKIGRGNSLYYEINKSQGVEAPQKVYLFGNYSLDKNHNLLFTLNRWNNQYEGNRFSIKARLIDATSNEIVFLVNSREGDTKEVTYMIRLTGSWSADRQNRLTFGVERDCKDCDRLTLFNAWEIDENNEIVYRYNPEGPAISLRGQWEIHDRYTLSYVLDKVVHSGFDFNLRAGRIFVKEKEVRFNFDVSIDISKRHAIHRNISFSGRWSRPGKGLCLEMSPAKTVRLKLTKDIFGRDGLIYLESFLKQKEGFIGAGFIFMW